MLRKFSQKANIVIVFLKHASFSFD